MEESVAQISLESVRLVVLNLYKKIIAPIYNIPLSQRIEVPSDRQRFLETRCFSLHWPLKALKRYLFLLVNSGFHQELSAIGREHQNILWISISAPSLGDVIQDVASRYLLVDKQIFLFTSETPAKLLENDHIFAGVTSNIEVALGWVARINFDLVILDSFSTRSVGIKRKITPKVPYVSMFRYLNGFEVHRLRYTFSRMAILAGDRTLKDVRLKPSLSLEGTPNQTRTTKDSNTIMIAIGGNWKFRDYNHWEDVISKLVCLLPERQLLLIGSDNGIGVANVIAQKYPQIKSLVGKQSVQEVALTIKNASYFIGVDGGLWHVANAYDVASTVLFAKCDLFDGSGRRVMRSTDDMRVNWLHHSEDVSCIAPNLVVKKVLEGLGQAQKVVEDREQA